MINQAKMVGFVVEFREIIGDRKVKKLIGDRFWEVKGKWRSLLGGEGAIAFCDDEIGEGDRF